MLVHILETLDSGMGRLPRAALTLHYPLAFLPLYPAAKVVGALDAVRLAYPVMASLAAVPAYLIVRKGRAPVAGVVAMLLLPDLMVKTLTGTPQGIALPLFVLALYFALRRHRTGFLICATAVLFTHHLTGLVTLVMYYTLWVLPRLQEHRFLRREWPYLLYFSSWPLYWAWTFSNTGQAYMAPILMILVVVGGVPFAVLLYLAAPRIHGVLGPLGGRVARMPAIALLLVGAAGALAGWLLSDLVLDSPGLSTAAVANRAVTAMYAALLVLGGAGALARRHLGLTLFSGTLLGLGAFVLAVGCQHVFDGLRVADYAVLGLVAALFAPGLRARWLSRRLLFAVAAIVVLAGVVRLGPGYDRLFAHTVGQREAARWVEANIPEGASIASDTKMSLLVLGEGGHNATFEGTWWLFDGSPVDLFVAELNNGHRFRDRPISYVLLSDYMLERGADVAWFSATLRPDASLPGRLDGYGEQVYDRGGVRIWRLDPVLVSGTGAGRIDLTADLLSRLHGGIAAGPCR